MSDGFIAEIAARKNVNSEEGLRALQAYAGQPLRTFYSDAVCGGVLLQFSDTGADTTGAEVPLAFQSALAGVMLAAEIVIDAAQLRRIEMRDQPPPITTIDVTRPLARHVNVPVARGNGGKCLCEDPDRLVVYSAKYRDDVVAGGNDLLGGIEH